MARFAVLLRSTFLTALAVTGLLGCQTEPTKVTETRIINFEELSKLMAAPIEIDDKTVVVDVRSSFDYTMAHIPNSINLRWEEFAQVRGPVPGLLQKDLTRLARRLALKGVGPQSRVVVVGNGLDGQGEEGRMAWTLFYLGIPRVQVAHVENFRKLMTNVQTVIPKNAEEWSPKVVNSVQAARNEILKSAMAKKGSESAVHILDVRTKKEYFGRKGKGFGMGYKVPDLQAMHIHWKEFFTASGQIKTAMKNQLRSVGIGLNDRILVVSNQGVRSGAVTMALLALGFHRSANFTGGYAELLKGR